MSQDVDQKEKTSTTASFVTPSPSQCATSPPVVSKTKPKTKGFFSEFHDRAKFNKIVERDRLEYEEILHQKRVASILSEVKYLEETDWMHPSIESILGFKDERPIMLPSRYESAANLAEAHMFQAVRGEERPT